MKAALVSLIAALCGVFAPGTNAFQEKTPAEAEADQLNAQVVRFFREKKFKEALPPAKRALELREKALGPEHALTVVALVNLASVYSELDRHGDAANARQRVLKAQEKQYGESSVKLCDNLSKLGWERLLAGDEGAAGTAFKRNLQIREAAHGVDHKDIIPALNDLALWSQRNGKHGESAGYFNRMIAIKEKELGDNHPDVAELLIKCAIVMRQGNKKAEADEYEARARKIYASLPSNPGAEPATVSNKVLQGTAILRVQPGYPPGAKQSRVQGAVQVLVVIDEIGSVTKATAISGPAELIPASEDAARQWRFKPTIVNGRAVVVQGVLTFNFTLR